MNCKHCTNGRINDYGDEWFAQFECTGYGAVYQTKPKITKRNNRYFLYVGDSLSMIPIKACPICGRSFEVNEDSHGEWLDNDDEYTADMLHYRCSICGNYEYTREKFCSKCGAKMKGGAE